MLPPFIIDQIRRREEQENVREVPVKELPLPNEPLPRKQKPSEDEPKRGVVIIDLG